MGGAIDMRIEEISGPDWIIEDLKPSLRTDAIRELMELIGRKRGFKKVYVEELLGEVLKRHEKTPCGLGRGLAFPNARTDNVAGPSLAVGFSKKGLDCGGKDAAPAHVILLYVGRATPLESERAMLGRLSRALSSVPFAERLVYSGGALGLWETLSWLDHEAIAGVQRRKA